VILQIGEQFAKVAVGFKCISKVRAGGAHRLFRWRRCVHQG
jgi:hypothetical protein